MNILSDILLMLLSLPVVVVSLSVHESSHGYAAYKLGDPTAYRLGRISLNPLKHFDLFGFLSMLLIHVGWAKPVPIDPRYFKDPKKGMAITGAAGPLSNICLSIIHLILLRVVMFFVTNSLTQNGLPSELTLSVWAIAAYILYMGVAMNVVLAIFNLIPLPPFDGSRIFYAFLPNKWYFGVMRYERYVMLACLLGFFVLNRLNINPLFAFERWVINGLFTVSGMGGGTMELGALNLLLSYLEQLVSLT